MKFFFKKNAIFISLLGLVMSAFAQNPISPPGIFIADPEAHVAADGKLYVYGSLDESDKYWCSHTHHVLSTTDMIHWNIDLNSFSSQGKNDQVSYTDKLLFAPDCAYRNGTYYLYYCFPALPFSEGVATSTSPYGPFVKGLDIKGAYGIDPAVLVDGDNAYYYWGQGVPKVAKLKPNMLEIDSTTITNFFAGTRAENHFHEGSSIRKIGNMYYFVFADESRRNHRPTCLGYATSASPMGPFVYRGVLIDNFGSDPAVWNNHGSIQQFNGQWYVFYHRSTNGSQKFRKACVEPITINTDGSIDEVEMSSQGASPPLDAFSRIEAEWSCGLTGSVRIIDFDENQEKLGKIQNDNTAKYKYINFGDGANQFAVKTLGKTAKGQIEVWIDGFNGHPAGTCEIPSYNNEFSYQVITCKIKMTTGKHIVYLKFIGESDNLFDIDWVTFNK
jgi:arabinoxylan arabinofuranohydrolase